MRRLFIGLVALVLVLGAGYQYHVSDTPVVLADGGGDD